MRQALKNQRPIDELALCFHKFHWLSQRIKYSHKTVSIEEGANANTLAM